MGVTLDDDNEAVAGIVVNDDEDSSKKEAPVTFEEEPRYPASFFTDEIGNLKFVNFVCRFPFCVIFVILLICLLAIYGLVTVVFARGNPFSARDSYNINDLRSQNYDSLRLATSSVEELRVARETQKNDAEVVTRRQSKQQDVTYWVFEAGDLGGEGIFGTKKGIEDMREAESLFTKHVEYKNFCQLDYYTDGSSSCKKPISPLNMYYASTWDSVKAEFIIEELKKPKIVELLNNEFICRNAGKSFCDVDYTEDEKIYVQKLISYVTHMISSFDGTNETVVEDFDQVTMLAASLLQVKAIKKSVEFGFDKDFSIENPKTMFSRSLLPWGGPYSTNLTGIDGDTTAEELKKKEEEREDEDEELLKNYIVKNFLKKMDEIADTKYHSTIDSYYFMPVLILEVLLEIVIKDGSLAIYSLLFVFLWLGIMVGSWFLAFIGFLEIVLSLPLAWFMLDCVFQIRYFSFLNALCLFIVAAIGADDIFIFMDGYKQSAFQSPQVLESLESRMSWVYRRTGSAMAITSATTCSAFLCTLLTPLADVRAFGIFAALVILMDYILVMTLFCTAVVIYHNKFEKPACCCAPTCCMGGICATASPNPTEQSLANVQAGEQGQGGRITNFFRNQFTNFITGSVWNRVIIGVVFLAWIIVAITQTTKLKPTEQTEQFLSDDHPLQKSFTIIGSAFPAVDSDRGSSVYFSWGVGKVDRDGVNQLFDPEFIGEATFQDDFLFDGTCQTAILKACDHLKESANSPFVKSEKGVGSVECFVEEMAAFYALNSLDDCAEVRSNEWRNATWQIPLENITSEFIERFSDQTSCYSGDDDDEKIGRKYATSMGWDGKKMAYALVGAENPVINRYANLPEIVVRKQYDKMVEFTSKFDIDFSGACGSKVLMTDLDMKFVFMNTQTIYVKSAITSSFLGVAIAFTVLMMATRVFHIAALATLSIICVLLSITGSIVLLGWSLGSIEAILISIVAGFSVDYVVHLAHAYERAKNNDTTERIRLAFGEMGISVFNGMLTSIGASIPLFLCSLQFFSKFGTFLCLTIAFSWLFANLAFMSVLAQARIPMKEGSKCRL